MISIEELNEDKFRFKIGQKVYYAGIPYGVLDRYLDDDGTPYYIIRPFSKTGTSYSGLPVPEDALVPEHKDGDIIWTTTSR